MNATKRQPNRSQIILNLFNKMEYNQMKPLAGNKAIQHQYHRIQLGFNYINVIL